MFNFVFGIIIEIQVINSFISECQIVKVIFNLKKLLKGIVMGFIF